MNLMILMVLFIGMVIAVGGFVGLICLQVHISKNNKKGKFAIPIIMFVLPVIVVALLIVVGMAAMNNVQTFSGEIEETYVVEDEAYTVVSEEGETPVVFGAATVMFSYIAAALGFPCAIVTLIIELVYRSKRKRITDEDVIDIQNL